MSKRERKYDRELIANAEKGLSPYLSVSVLANEHGYSFVFCDVVGNFLVDMQLSVRDGGPLAEWLAFVIETATLFRNGTVITLPLPMKNVGYLTHFYDERYRYDWNGK